jgi:hypothetical protein
MTKENNSCVSKFKSDLYDVLRKHGMGIDEAMEALDDLFYDIYNSGRSVRYTTTSNSETK